MTKNPLLNALAGIAYIALVSSIMFFGMQHAESEDTVVIPIAILSLFSLSAAIMGYIFLFQPVQLYLDGKKKQATTLLLKTILAFAVITSIIFALIISGVLK